MTVNDWLWMMTVSDDDENESGLSEQFMERKHNTQLIGNRIRGERHFLTGEKERGADFTVKAKRAQTSVRFFWSVEIDA